MHTSLVLYSTIFALSMERTWFTFHCWLYSLCIVVYVTNKAWNLKLETWSTFKCKYFCTFTCNEVIFDQQYLYFHSSNGVVYFVHLWWQAIIQEWASVCGPAPQTQHVSASLSLSPPIWLAHSNIKCTTIAVALRLFGSTASSSLNEISCNKPLRSNSLTHKVKKKVVLLVKKNC